MLGSLQSRVLPLLLSVLFGTAGGQDRDSFVEGPCQEESSRLLILGTYHMANPGLDSYNVEADYVRSERRQKEIGELLDRRRTRREEGIPREGPRSTRKALKSVFAVDVSRI